MGMGRQPIISGDAEFSHVIAFERMPLITLEYSASWGSIEVAKCRDKLGSTDATNRFNMAICHLLSSGKANVRDSYPAFFPTVFWLPQVPKNVVSRRRQRLFQVGRDVLDRFGPDG